MEYFKSKSKVINRLSLSFQALDVKDTTITHVNYQSALKEAKETLLMMRGINLCLSVSVVLAGIYLLFNLIFGYKMAEDSMFVAEAAMAQPSEEALELPPVRAFSEYQALLAKRNLFEPYALSKSALAEAIEAARQEMIQKFLVIGVFIDKEPKVIVELIGQNETVFAMEGERIEGALIKKVLEDGVVVIYNDIEIELKR